MKHKNNYIIDAEMLNKIISVAYGDASLKERYIVYKASKKRAEIKALLEEYRSTARSVHALPLEECPDEITDLMGCKFIPREKTGKSFWFDVYSAFFSRPLLSAVAATMIVIAMLTSILFFEKNHQAAAYSMEEIEQANNQVKYALALVKDAFNKSNNILSEDILKNKIAVPIGEGIKYVNTLLMEEN